jgi:hypothetical protein
MKREVIGKCPICGGQLKVTRLSCNDCKTIIEGQFELCKFCKLTAEQKAFLESFVKCRGNIKEMEKELGVSYPTVKNRLEDVAGVLGYSTEEVPVESQNTTQKKEILEKLNNGEISAQEAVELLKTQI